jgi:hypothetical protein
LKKESKVKNLAKFQSNKAGSRKLKNTSSKSSIENLCDPFSSDPDTGILSCGTGRRCQPSKTSSLGGECKDVGTRPRLTNPGAWRNSRGKRAVKAVECVPVGADVGVLWDVELVKFVLRAWNRLWEAFAPLSLHVTSKLPIIMVSVIQHHTIMDSTTVIALLSTTPPKLETFHVYKRANALVPCIMGVMIHA